MAHNTANLLLAALQEEAEEQWRAAAEFEGDFQVCRGCVLRLPQFAPGGHLQGLHPLADHQVCRTLFCPCCSVHGGVPLQRANAIQRTGAAQAGAGGGELCGAGWAGTNLLQAGAVRMYVGTSW